MATPAASFNVLVPRGSRIANFLDLIYLLDKNCETQKAVGQVVDFVDGLLNEGEFEECSDVLNQVDVARLSPPIVISILGITRGARPSLRPTRIQLCTKPLRHRETSVPSHSFLGALRTRSHGRR